MRLEIIAVEGIGEVVAGTDLVDVIAGTADLRDGDVVVVSSKVVSKAEGREVPLAAGETAAQARRRLAEQDEVLADTPWVVVVRTDAGLVCANAGIDASNVPGGGVLLLPADPDAAAADLRRGLQDRLGVAVGVVVADTFGRAWREGQTDIALGVAGLPALRDERGRVDRDGRPLSVTLVAVADQVAGAADLVRDKAAGVPVVVVRGLPGVGEDAEGSGRDLIRPPAEDLFPHGRGWLARRLATGAGRPTRVGSPSAWEWALVVDAAGGGSRGPDRLVVADGLAAGRAEAALLDLGYAAVIVNEDPWTVAVHPQG